MKKIKLFLAIIMCLFAMPLAVLADEGSDDNVEVTSGETEVQEEDNRVKIYFFRGEGCPHCADAEEFFNSIEEEYGQYYKILDYETWYNSDNAALLQKVGEARNEEISGVPYILIGDKSWSGYDDSFADEIKDTIKSEYEKAVADRYDIANYVDFTNAAGSVTEAAKKSNDAMVLIIILLAVAGITYGVVAARKKTV
ncbi:hypothetical membrane protein [Mycoplasma sp. CAG:877]|nr:hypothetical membrane protein [Mycoplasma sp. CAG:877]